MPRSQYARRGDSARLAELGFPREDRPFSPHITLGRVKTPTETRQLAALVREHACDAFGDMPVTEMHMIRSEL